MNSGIWSLLNRRPKRWAHLHHVPLRQLSVLLMAVFFLFSVMGFYSDIMSGGRKPYAVVLVSAGVIGMTAAAWMIVLSRLTVLWMFIFGGLQVASSYINVRIDQWLPATFHLVSVDAKDGTRFASTATVMAIMISYLCFVMFIRVTGREAFRLRNELALAHSIQKTLVPPIDKRTSCFEIYGISEPSEKVGGDLVDVVQLRGGDSVAYLADIAGHGLQAGILMGMLKTAARTALSGDCDRERGTTLSNLMGELNEVLPQVKEAHMYATFTALRLNQDGQVFYGTAASPPLLHWTAATKSVTRIQEDQFPLGLLPVSGFPACQLEMGKDDVVLVATDGIYEVAARSGAEFGIEALEALLMGHGEVPLAELAGVILKTVRGYGKQVDDQTLLLVRKTSG